MATVTHFGERESGERHAEEENVLNERKPSGKCFFRNKRRANRGNRDALSISSNSTKDADEEERSW